MPVNQRADMRQEARQPFEASAPQAIRHAMKDARVQTRVASYHLKCRARRRVAVEHTVYVFPDGIKHLLPVRFPLS